MTILTILPLLLFCKKSKGNSTIVKFKIIHAIPSLFQDLEADTDAIMGEELPTTTSTSGETGSTTAADTKSDIKLEARSTSAQSMQKSKEQQSSQITSPDLGSEETVNNSKKESGNNSVKDSTGGIQVGVAGPS